MYRGELTKILGAKSPEADFRNAVRTAETYWLSSSGELVPGEVTTLIRIVQRAAAGSEESPTARVPDENRPAVLGKAAFVQLLADDQTGGRVSKGSYR